MNASAALLEHTLTRAAEQIGDITQPVMSLYYQRHPEARTAFEAHCQGNRAALEGDMVERILYCLMYWLESPGEIEIMLAGSVIHHADTLQVTPLWFEEMLGATADIIGATIPGDSPEELAVWNRVCGELCDVIRQSSKHVWAPTAAL
ncbi:MAG: hypothetical protein ACRCVD_15770 [Halioglobus sp.]